LVWQPTPAKDKAMNSDRDPSLAELRSESERTRASLTNSAEQLRAKMADTATEFKTRMSPAHIKEEVKGQLRDTGQAWIETLKQQASDNPLQTVAIGAGIAYPLLGLLRTIPAPILLMGAGLFLASQKRNSAVQSAAADAGVRVSELADSAQAAAAAGIDRLTQAAGDAQAKTAAGARSVMDQVAQVAADGQKAASDLGQSLLDKAQTTAHAAADAATNLQQSASETADAFRKNALELGVTSQKTVMEFAERNPLLIAGAALAVGALIAAAVPPSDAENRLFGEGSDALKRQANRAAAAGLQQARDIAGNVAGEVTSAAAQHGLTTDSLTKAIEGVTAGVKSVADKGLQTALAGGEKVQQTST